MPDSFSNLSRKWRKREDEYEPTSQTADADSVLTGYQCADELDALVREWREYAQKNEHRLPSLLDVLDTFNILGQLEEEK